MTRNYWIQIAKKLSVPILSALSQRKFRNVFVDKNPIACFEAFARVLLGIAPWLELNVDKEATMLAVLARQSLDAISDPFSPDYVGHVQHEQMLVETALLAQALLRGYSQLWLRLDSHVQTNITNIMCMSRNIKPHDNNWSLFPCIIEAFLLKSNHSNIRFDRLHEGILFFEKWYVGDGMYGDGVEFHFDYYNSYIIHPMLMDTLEVLTMTNKETCDKVRALATKESVRFQRLAVIQERLIAPDGTFPPIGRSLTYRCGAFHSLALCAYRKVLPDCLKPSQVREALTRVIRATLEPKDTFEKGWLTIGLYGKQPNLAEPYINHGSVYFCSTVLLPLGLSMDEPFWSDGDDSVISWEAIMNGQNVKRDKPYCEHRRLHGRCV